MLSQQKTRKTPPLLPRRRSKNSSPSTRCEETHEVLKLPKGIYSSPFPRYLNPFTSHNGIPLVCLRRTLYLDFTILPLAKGWVEIFAYDEIIAHTNCNCFILSLDAATRLTKYWSCENEAVHCLARISRDHRNRPWQPWRAIQRETRTRRD